MTDEQANEIVERLKRNSFFPHGDAPESDRVVYLDESIEIIKEVMGDE